MNRETIKELYYLVREKAGAEEFDRRIRGWLNNYNRQLDRPAVASGKATEAVKFCQEVLSHLNQILGSEYTLLEEYQTKITYWQKKGKSLDDFRKVHKLKYAQWFNEPKMLPYLRPSTLYCKKHFDEYLQEANVLLVKKEEKIILPQRAQSTQRDSKENHEFVMKRIKLMGDLTKTTDFVERNRLQEELRILDANRNKEK